MKKILIANRGEIAVRIIQAAKDYGLKSVAIYADSDCDALFVRRADEAFSLEGDQPKDTYLNIEKIITLAKKSGADALHPGYGFLSESSQFARKVLEAGLIWIGPSPEIIDMLGDKVQARATAQKVGAPLVAGSDGAVNSPEEVQAFTKQFGFPIAIKAAHGGGGRGMKVVWQEADITESFHSAVREAITAFGRGECYVEQFLDRPRHVEAQIIADKHGNVVVVGDRDCSMQRRNQKLIEEAPAPFLTKDQRQRIHVAAAAICKEAGYVGAGTVEFLLGNNGVISFLEVNTRLQVEHPVTEETSNVDLVVEQFRVAEGLPLSFDKTPEAIGHAIEFRINAEDVARGFLPSPGEITLFEAPSGIGVRVDSGVVTGSYISPMFDSMMAKIIVRGQTRDHALARARRVLKEFIIEGVASVLPFHRLVVDHDDFTAKNGFKVHTRWIETDFSAMLEEGVRSTAEPMAMQRSFIEIDGKRVALGLPAAFLQNFAGFSMKVGQNNNGSNEVEDLSAVKASVPGTIRAWLVADQAHVNKGDAIAVMEAMKMETTIFAPASGPLSIIALSGSVQKAGAIIAHIDA